MDINREGKKVLVGRNKHKVPIIEIIHLILKQVDQLKGRYLNVSPSLNDNNKYVVYGIGTQMHVYHNNMRGREEHLNKTLKDKKIIAAGITDVRVELDNMDRQFVYYLNVNGQLYNHTQETYKWEDLPNGGRLDPSSDFLKILHYDIGLNKENFEFHHLWIIDSSYTLKYKKMVFTEEPVEEEFYEEEFTTQAATTAGFKIFEDLFTPTKQRYRMFKTLYE